MVALVCLSIQTYAQEAVDHRGFIGVSLGPSIPTGDYSSNSITNRRAGFARTGATFNINFHYKFSKYIGIAAISTGNAHPLNEEEHVKTFQWIDPALRWELNTDLWSVGGTLGGILLSFPAGFMDIDLKGLIGFSYSELPEMRVTGSSDTFYETVIQRSSSASSPALNLGTNFRFAISDNWSLTFNIDYFITNPEFNIKTETNFAIQKEFTIKRNISMLNLSFGAGYRFH